MPTTVDTHRLSDADIIEIMHTHSGWRQHVARPMSDAEFIKRFREIVPYNSVCDAHGYVTTSQIAKIYNLRLTYECAPRSPKGFLPSYTDKSVRLQNGAARLPWVEESTMYAILGYETKRMSYAWLRDVLEMRLMRWGYERRKPQKDAVEAT